jgi:transcriptional regulator with XRE-family HTH domain
LRVTRTRCVRYRRPTEAGHNRDVSRTKTAQSDGTVGTRLREARLARGLSLKGVESATKGQVSSATISAYERGERPISAVRLCLLADLYGVGLDSLIESGGALTRPQVRTLPDRVVRFDLGSLQDPKGRDARVASSLVKEVQRRRSHNVADTIAVRHEDLEVAAMTVGKTYELFVDSLRKAGVLRRSRGRPPGS